MENEALAHAKGPEVGKALRVRDRLATVSAVKPYDCRSGQGRLRLIDVERLGDWRYPESEQTLWEVEATAKVLGRTSLPSVDAMGPDGRLEVVRSRRVQPLDVRVLPLALTNLVLAVAEDFK